MLTYSRGSGDWAGNVWNDAGAPGQEQSCATRVGVSTCEEYVQNHGSSFSDACECLFNVLACADCSQCPTIDWEVGYVKIFQ